jgi:hypothetical protein
VILQEEEQERPGFAGRSCAATGGGFVHLGVSGNVEVSWNGGTPKSSIFIAGWWFGTFFIFHNIWDVILPIDFHIFQDGYCTTNQIGLSIVNKASIFWGSTILGHQPRPGDIEWDLRRVNDKKGSG